MSDLAAPLFTTRSMGDAERQQLLARPLGQILKQPLSFGDAIAYLCLPIIAMGYGMIRLLVWAEGPDRIRWRCWLTTWGILAAYIGLIYIVHRQYRALYQSGWVTVPLWVYIITVIVGVVVSRRITAQVNQKVAEIQATIQSELDAGEVEEATFQVYRWARASASFNRELLIGDLGCHGVLMLPLNCMERQATILPGRWAVIQSPRSQTIVGCQAVEVEADGPDPQRINVVTLQALSADYLYSIAGVYQFPKWYNCKMVVWHPDTEYDLFVELLKSGRVSPKPA